MGLSESVVIDEPGALAGDAVGPGIAPLQRLRRRQTALVGDAGVTRAHHQ